MENNIRLITGSLLMLVISSILLSVLLACSKSKPVDMCSKNNSPILSGHEYKIWRFDNEKFDGIGGYFYFDNKQNCINLLLSRNGEFSKYQADDVVVDPTWRVNGDTLFLEQLPYIIIQSSIDTICIKHIGNGRINYLIDIGIPPKIK